MEDLGTVERLSDVSGMFYGSQRITIVGTGMNHGRHLAEVLDWNGLGMERICHYWRRHLSSVSKSMGFRSVKKCALAEGQLASIAFLMSLSTLHP